MPTEIVGTMAVSGGQKQTALLMPGAYPADKVTYNGTNVDDTLDEIKKNKLDNYIDIKSYNTTSNPYVFPCDGYVYVGGSTANEVSIYGSDDFGTKTFAISNASNQYNSVYVRKGMRAVFSTGNMCRFVPLI
jgi:hypothetical protein